MLATLNNMTKKRKSYDVPRIAGSDLNPMLRTVAVLSRHLDAFRLSRAPALQKSWQLAFYGAFEFAFLCVIYSELRETRTNEEETDEMRPSVRRKKSMRTWGVWNASELVENGNERT